MSHWNYRVLVTGTGEKLSFDMHEVFYNDDGVPDGATENPVTIGSSDAEGVGWTLEKMKEALDKPVLHGDDRFPDEYIETEKT